MKQKFNPGDTIRITGCSNPMYMAKTEWPLLEKFGVSLKESEAIFWGVMKEEDRGKGFYDHLIRERPPQERIISEDDTIYVLNMAITEIGCTDTIVGSYRDIYPTMSNSEDDKHSYSLKKRGSWYREDCMELVKSHKGKRLNVADPINETVKAEFEKLK